MAKPAEFARREILSRRWNDAKDEKWRRSLKDHPPVFEIYYDEQPTAEQLKVLGQKVTRCLDTFLKSDLAAELQEEDGESWLAVDPDFREAPKLELNGHVVWALPDFARRCKNGRVEIWDWKTGRKHADDELQLLSYALFAREHWDVEADQIDLKGFYLDSDQEFHGVVDYECNATALKGIEDIINSDIAKMKRLLVDVEHNRPHSAESHFPLIEPSDTCRRCNFKELCQRN